MDNHEPLPSKLETLRTDRFLTIDEVAEATGLSRSAIASYESKGCENISPFALKALADFYHVSTDFLVGLTDNHTNHGKHVDALHLTDPAVDVLKEDRLNNLLISELITHPDFRKFLIDLEIYIDGYFSTRLHQVNAPLEEARQKILAKYPDAAGDLHTEALKESQIDEDHYVLELLDRDLLPIMHDLRECHKKDTATISDSSLNEFADQTPELVSGIQSSAEASSPDSSFSDNIEEAVQEMQEGKGTYQEYQTMTFCKQLGIKYQKLTDEEKVYLIRILGKSSKLKAPNNGRKFNKNLNQVKKKKKK